MVEARFDDQWWHTSSLIAKLHNVNITKRSQALSPEEVHPVHAEKLRQQRQQETFRNLFG